MRLRWTRRALTNLDQIGSHLALNNPAAASRVVNRIRDAVGLLGEHPEAGRIGRVNGTREVVLADIPYTVAYRVTPEAVDVLTVLHAYRRWPRRF